MTDSEVSYLKAGHSLRGAEESQMFGKPCFKVNGKAFISLFDGEMVFKLNGEAHTEALSYDGAKMFDPSGKGRYMKEWVQLPPHYMNLWSRYAKEAFEYVKGMRKNDK